MSAFQVDLRGMVDLLSRNLYSGPRVYVRELLQNAVDAIAARRAIEPDCPQRVTIELGRADGAATLTCTDTGVGLTADEVDELLSTIGASSKRDELGLARGDYLGQFGIGLLSCFMVSPEIVVTSRSARGGGSAESAGSADSAAPAVRWRGRTDGTYSVEPVPDSAADAPREPGAAIALRALPSEDWLAPETVRALVEEFGHLLPVDIEVRSDDGAVTYHGRGRGPWEMPRGQAVQWCTDELGSEPFDLLDLDVPAAGLHGTIAIMGRAAPTAEARHTVSVKRMLVTRAAEGLAPDWAYFVRVIADAEHLHLTASRESLVDDDLLETVRETIGGQVRDWIERLGRAAPTRLDAFVAAHAIGLCSVAVEDPEMLGLVARHVPLTTTAGEKTLAELVALAGRGMRVRWTRTVDQFRALADVAAAQGIVLINAGHAYEAEIIAALALHPEALDNAAGISELALVDPDEILNALTPVTPAEEAEAIDLLRLAGSALTEVDVEVVLRRFDPATTPALYLPDPDLAGRRAQASSAAGAAASRAAAVGAWSQVLGVTDPFAAAPRPRLVLNRASALVAQLVAVTGTSCPANRADPVGRATPAGPRPDEATITRVLRGLYVQCLLTGHHSLTAKERAWAAQTLSTLLTSALTPSGPTISEDDSAAPTSRQEGAPS